MTVTVVGRQRSGLDDAIAAGAAHSQPLPMS